MIQFSNLALRRGVKVLFDQADLRIADGAKVGLVIQSGSAVSKGLIDCQAVLRTETVDSQATLHIESPSGPTLNVMRPPYSLVAPESLTARQ